jgi:hypothetical protein
MYRIIDERASGKTSRLMLIAKENGATFVCSNPRAMEAKARAYGILGIEFMSYSDAIDHMRNPDSRHTAEHRRSAIVIDEMENFVKYALGMNGSLIGYTISNED